MTPALEFKDVDILFPGSGRRAAVRLQAALAELATGASRASIAEKTGVLVGVAGANLTIEQGQICILMGLSGSGKSTLLRAANGLTPVSRGAVLVRDGATSIDIARCDAARLRQIRRMRIAMVFQQFGLLPWRTVRENVALGLELRGEPAVSTRRIVTEQLELVGLTLGRSLLRRVIRRYAAARRTRARLGDQSGHPAHGRALLRARPAAASQITGRVARPAAARAQNHRIREPRPR